MGAEGVGQHHCEMNFNYLCKVMGLALWIRKQGEWDVMNIACNKFSKALMLSPMTL